MDNATTMRRIYDLINAGDIDGFGAVVADTFVEYEVTPGLPPNKEGLLDFFRMMIAAFPDLRMVPEDVIGSGDKVVARVRASGTHKGEFMGMAPTGKRIEVAVIDIMRFGADGQVVEHWGLSDQMAMMQQLGAIPGVPEG